MKRASYLSDSNPDGDKILALEAVAEGNRYNSILDILGAAMEIQPGTGIYITHDIVINGLVAFGKGDRAVVEQIAENQQRPEYRYVVCSTKVDKRFQLSDNDILLIPEQETITPSAPILATHQETPQTVPVPKTKLSSRKMNLIMVGGTVLAVLGLVAIILVVLLPGGSSDSTPLEQANSSATQNSGLQVVGIYKATDRDETFELKVDGTYVDTFPATPAHETQVFTGTYKVTEKNAEVKSFMDNILYKTTAEILFYESGGDYNSGKKNRPWYLTEDGNLLDTASGLYVRQ